MSLVLVFPKWPHYNLRGPTGCLPLVNFNRDASFA